MRHVCNNKKYRHQYPRISIRAEATPVRGVMEGFLEEVVSKGVGRKEGCRVDIPRRKDKRRVCKVVLESEGQRNFRCIGLMWERSRR